MSRSLRASRALHVAHKNLSSLARSTTPQSATFLRTRLDHPPLPLVGPSTPSKSSTIALSLTSGARGYGNAAVAFKPREERAPRRYKEESFEDEAYPPTTELTRSRDSQESDERLVNYLERTFEPLKFSTPLAKRILTHVSYKFASDGHNARLAFLGRRTLHAYFHLFLAHCPPEKTTRYDFDELTSSAMNTYVLGEHVAKSWNLPRYLRWNSSLFHGSHTFADADEPRAMFVHGVRSREDDAWLKRLDGVSSQYKLAVGMYKVLGTTVEAAVGGVYHQFGGAVAHRVFLTHVLPYILLHGEKEGVQNSLIPYADELIHKMGGPRSPLALATGDAAKQSQDQWARAVM